MKRLLLVTAVLALLCASVAASAAVTGDPVSDGWVLGGNSLENGVYVRGSANYGFDAYSKQITGLAITDADPTYSWLVGDTVLGLGGKFAGITAAEAGWSAFTGNAVNSLLGGTQSIKIQGKFGTAGSDFSASTVAPDAGNGGGSLGTNGKTGAVQIRSSAYFSAATWAAGSGILQPLDKVSHIIRQDASAPDMRIARLIWNWDSTNARLSSWEILLNTSLLDRTDGGFAGPTPTAGDLSLVTVQNGDGAYTDAVVRSVPETVVPEPVSLILGIMGLGSVAGFKRLRRK